MKTLDILLFAAAIILVVCIIILIQALKNPGFFEILTTIGLFENSKEGIIDAMMTLAYMVVPLLLIFIVITIRTLKKLFTKNSDDI